MHVVLDASAVVELVPVTVSGVRIRRRLSDPRVSMHGPELVDLEVLDVLRRYVNARLVTMDRATAAVRTLDDLDLQRHRHGPMLRRIWARRSNLTAYDAAYVALAEALNGPLPTTDVRLANAPNLPVPVEVFAAEPLSHRSTRVPGAVREPRSPVWTRRVRFPTQPSR